MSVITEQEIRAVASDATAAPNDVPTLRLRAQQIRSFEPPTRVAGAPAHVPGVTSRRGVTVPIVDLRGRCGLEAAFGSDTVTVALGIGGRTAGALVDAASGVVAMTPGFARPAPGLGGAVGAGHVTGVASPGEGERARMPMLMLMDIENLMTGATMGRVAETVH